MLLDVVLWTMALSAAALLATARPVEVTDPWPLALLRLVHLTLTGTIVLYPLASAVSSSRFGEDVVFAALATMVVASWYLSPGGECILSTWEKQALDGSYVAGDAPTRHVYLEGIVGAERASQLIIFVAMLVGYCWVCLRLAAAVPHAGARWTATAAVLALGGYVGSGMLRL